VRNTQLYKKEKMRAEYQVLIIPFIMKKEEDVKYGIFKRKDNNAWQFIAGGGEDKEKPIEAAIRETREETNILSNDFYILKTKSMVPIVEFNDHKNKKGLYVIPEYCFGVKINDENINISNEHIKYRFVNYKKAISLLRFDGNKTALWELNTRIKEIDLIKIS
jgi:dATP pyrophosphohydrolase